MKTLAYFILGFFVISGLSACSRYNYYTAGLNKTNMSGYKSFAFVEIEGNDKSKLIESTVSMALTKKGLKAQTDNPDLLVTYTDKVGRGSKTVYSPIYYGTGFYPGFGFGWGYYRPYYYGYYGFNHPFVYYGGETAVDKEHYKEGTIIINLIDTHTKKIVWRGFGVGEVHHNPQKNIDDIPKVVSGIIDQLQLTPKRSS